MVYNMLLFVALKNDMYVYLHLHFLYIRRNLV